MRGPFIASLFFVSSLALPAADHVVHEKRELPSYDARRRLEPDAIIPLRIALRQNNLHTGYDRLMDVSHPTSTNYGKHLSAEEVHDIFAPTEETTNAVKDWLLNAGLDESEIMHFDNKGWLAVDIPAHHAEFLFKTEYFEYEDASESLRIGCDEYSLPVHISHHVDLIKPGIKLSAPLSKRTVKRSTSGWPGPGGHHHGPPHFPAHHWPHPQPPGGSELPADLKDCDKNITPPCIRALYNIPEAHLSDPANVIGIFEEADAFSQQDLNLFFKTYSPNIPQGTSPTVYSVDGGVAPVAPGSVLNTGESDLDITMAYSLIYPQGVTVYQVDDIPYSTYEVPTKGFLNTFLDAVDGSYCNHISPLDPVYPDQHKGGYKGQLMCGVYELTRVLSISYGESEVTVPKRYAERQCNEIMKLGLQGHSIFVASGDYGVASFPGSDGDKYGCLKTSKDEKRGTIYNPDFSSGCPYITSVGATQLYPGQTVNDPESALQENLTAWHIEIGSAPIGKPYALFASSGGFSNYFTPPVYQSAAVSAYLASHNDLPYYIANARASNIGENGGVYNRGGRGWPDVSANGAKFTTFTNLTIYRYFGTSLSAPLFASVINLINDERTAVGKGPVGFVNPTLYEHPYVLNDITNGSNPNCGSAGFPASEGWDPVTGLGTPNYPAMLKLFMSLP